MSKSMKFSLTRGLQNVIPPTFQGGERLSNIEMGFIFFFLTCIFFQLSFNNYLVRKLLQEKELKMTPEFTTKW